MNKLKYSIYLLLIPIALFLTYSCNDDNKDEIGFKIVKTTIETSPYSLEGTVELSSPDFEYETLFFEEEWCEVTKEGNTLKLTAGINYDFNNRSMELLISSGDTKYRVPVTQVGVVFEFYDNNLKQYNLGLPGGERTIQLMSNVEYDVVIPEEDQEWLSVEPLENNLYKIIVGEGTEPRVGKVGFQFHESYIEILINQFDYMSYEELLGSAKMIYTDMIRDTTKVEVDIEVVEKEFLKSYIIKFKSRDDIEYELPFTFIDTEEIRGEIRLIPEIIDKQFRDPEKNVNIKSLSTAVYSYEYDKDGINLIKEYQKFSYPTGASYLPTTYTPLPTGHLFKFVHKDGCVKGAGLNVRIAKGIAILGTNEKGSLKYGDPYEILMDIEIIKY